MLLLPDRFFSFFLIPAFWVVDIFLFNLEELLWSWKLFEYIQFCQERFRNRSRRWVGLDDTINEELPPDLRALDQMCLSVQFYMLGSLHASGIVLAVLGYMLVLHKNHNIFGDPMVVPIFAFILITFNIGKKVAFRIADRMQIWMVEGENDYEEVYDEGPGSRNTGALPPGMAAVDAVLADCIEDAFAAGYTDDTLAKLLAEATLAIPPGMSIQAAGAGGPSPPHVSTDSGQVALSQEQLWQLLQLQAQGLMPSPQRVAVGAISGSAGSVTCPQLSVLGPTPAVGSVSASASSLLPSGVLGYPGFTHGSCSAPLGGVCPPAGIAGMIGTAAPSDISMPATDGYLPFPPAQAWVSAQAAAASTLFPSAFGPQPMGQTPYSSAIPQPPIDSRFRVPTEVTAGEESRAFNEFMNAFRVEMRQAKASNTRIARFVPSSAMDKARGIEEQANKIFDVPAPGSGEGQTDGWDVDDDYDYWPDELVPLGISQDEQIANDTTPSITSSTEEDSTPTTEATSDSMPSDEPADLWPIELLIG